MHSKESTESFSQVPIYGVDRTSLNNILISSVFIATLMQNSRRLLLNAVRYTLENILVAEGTFFNEIPGS